MVLYKISGLVFMIVLFTSSCTVNGLDDSVLEKLNFQIPEKWFQILNSQWSYLNQWTAYIAWELSVNPNKKLLQNGIKLSSIKSRWRNIRCSEANDFNELNDKESRMLYLLCRGPKFTEYQATELSSNLNKMQDIYTGTKVCLPKNFDLCKNLDRIWNFTYIETSQGEIYPLDLSTVQPNQLNKLSELNYFDGNLSQDYYIFDSSQNVNSNTQAEIRKGPFICLNGEPELERIMSGDFLLLQRNDCMLKTNEILRWTWESWRMSVGPPIQILYPNAVFLMNIGANNNGYNNIGEVWREELEMPSLKIDVQKLLNDVKPFYKILHAVLRNALRDKYQGEEDIKANGPIPAHLLGNMWSQDWSAYHQLLSQFPVDLDKNIKQTNWTTIDMVKRADDFYSSMGLKRMSNKFWEKSYFEKSKNVSQCHGTAADMFQKDDFRMMVCAKKSIDDFYVIVHEMGHLQYYMSYKKQIPLFQDGTNTAFQESIGDAVFLGVMTPQHLNRLRLVPDQFLFQTEKNDDLLEVLKNSESSENFDHISFFDRKFPNITTRTSDLKIDTFDLSLLLRMALAKIPQIPFEYIIDKFRWDLFSGTVKFTESNLFFWDLLIKEQGIKPPDWKNRQHLFDAGAKYHVPDNTPYVRYFLASFIQAQIFKGFCEITVFGVINSGRRLPMPLHRCDIYGSKRVGKLLKQALELGASVHWSEVLFILTGSKSVTVEPLLEYYEPLIKWLEKKVVEEKMPVGW